MSGVALRINQLRNPIHGTSAVVAFDHGFNGMVSGGEDARAIIERQAERDLYPSQIDIADEVAKVLREKKTFGPGGKPLTGATIKRHALKGISSATNETRSIGIHRGKQGK